MARTLIIPDIHNQWATAEIIISDEAPDKVVLLGDYFDSYDDVEKIEMTISTAHWLHDSLKHENRTHLIGNHDLSYLSHGKLQCSGYSIHKERAVNKLISDEMWKKLQWYTWIDETWLCTHAGLSKDFYLTYHDRITNPLPVKTFLEKESEIAWETATSGTNDDHIFWHCSGQRGGIDPYGGILWCDWREFRPIGSIKQIMGHTPGDFVRQQGDNYCLDTMGKNWAIYDDTTRKMTIKGFDE